MTERQGLCYLDMSSPRGGGQYVEFINVCGWCVCGVSTYYRVCVEVRGHLCELGSLLPPLHGIHGSNPGLQACVVSAFTCKAILPASVWSSHEDLRNMGLRLRPCFFSPSFGQLLYHLYQCLGKLHSWPSQRVEPLSHPVISFRKQKVGGAQFPPPINAASTFLLVMFV